MTLLTWPLPINGETPQLIHSLMIPSDISQVAVECFKEGTFNEDGSFDCENYSPHSDCEKEFTCEIIAAHLLIPSTMLYERITLYREQMRPLPSMTIPMRQNDRTLADIFDVEQWVVRFKFALIEAEYMCSKQQG